MSHYTRSSLLAASLKARTLVTLKCEVGSRSFQEWAPHRDQVGLRRSQAAPVFPPIPFSLSKAEKEDQCFLDSRLLINLTLKSFAPSCLEKAGSCSQRPPMLGPAAENPQEPRGFWKTGIWLSP